MRHQFIKIMHSILILFLKTPFQTGQSTSPSAISVVFLLVLSLFSWVRRLGNAAAHEAAKFSLTSYQSFFNNGNLLTVLESICRADYLSSSPCLV